MTRVRAELDDLLRDTIDPELTARAYLGLLVNKGWIDSRPQVVVKQISEKLTEVKFVGEIVMSEVAELEISAGKDWTAYINRLNKSGWLQFKESDTFTFWHRDNAVTMYVRPDLVPRQVKAKLTRELGKLV
jgi:hypothetical protein